MKLGNAELPVLLFYRHHPNYRHYWIVEYDVRYTGPWNQFFSAFTTSDAHLLGTSLVQFAECPSWSHWRSLHIPPGGVKDMKRSSPGSVGRVMTEVPTLVIIVGIPARLQLEGEAETDREDSGRVLIVVITHGVTERLELAAAVNIEVGAERYRDDPPDTEVTELLVLAAKLVIVTEAEAELDRDGE